MLLKACKELEVKLTRDGSRSRVVIKEREDMGNELTHFDYDNLTHGTKTLVEQKTSEIRSRMGKAATSIIEIGEKLVEVKKALPHGMFLPWLAAEFQWNRITANKMMQVARTFKCTPDVHLPIGTAALYLLASDATPKEVKERFIYQAEQGEPVTQAEVKKAVNATRVRKQSTPMPQKEADSLEPHQPLRPAIPMGPKVALELPLDNPASTVNTLVTHFDKAYLEAIIEGLQIYLQGENNE